MPYDINGKEFTTATGPQEPKLGDYFEFTRFIIAQLTQENTKLKEVEELKKKLLFWEAP